MKAVKTNNYEQQINAVMTRIYEQHIKAVMTNNYEQQINAVMTKIYEQYMNAVGMPFNQQSQTMAEEIKFEEERKLRIKLKRLSL
jgi:hypothetical protein